MPIYEYECQKCHKRTELLQKINDLPLGKCPHCEGEVRKIVSAAGLQFKGSGWYITDYAKKNGQSTSEPKSDKKTTSDSAPAKSEGTSTPGDSSSTKNPTTGSKE